MKKSQALLWILVVVLLGGLVGASKWLSSSQEKPQRVEIADSPMPAVATEKEEAQKNAKQATLEPGRVVILETARGKVEFVLFEKDCPESAQRIAGLVEEGAYDGLGFGRVENWVIQIDAPLKEVPTMGCEFAHGLSNTAGAVGMARKRDRNSNTSIFYIVKESETSLDYDYTVFGYVIKGMDVVKSIQPDDPVKKASIRPSTEADRQLLRTALQSAQQTSS